MRNLKISASLLLMIFIVASCGVSENGFGSSIQKRKYTKGFYFNKNKSHKVSNNNVFSETKVLKEKEVVVEESIVESIATKSVAVEQEFVVTVQTTTIDKQKEEGSHQSSTKKKATVQKKDTKPVAPRQRKLREHQYYIPVKDKAKVADKKQQRSSSQSSGDDMFILAVIFAILIPPIGVAIYTNIDWKKVLICLLLTILFFLPGMIYALLVVFDVI